jgi:hypothetical protein
VLWIFERDWDGWSGVAPKCDKDNAQIALKVSLIRIRSSTFESMGVLALESRATAWQGQ